MRRLICLISLAIGLLLSSSCSNAIPECDAGESGKTCTKMTEEDLARRAIAEGDYDEARERLEGLELRSMVQEALLASAYAGLAGLSVKTILQSAASSGGNADPINLINSALPAKDAPGIAYSQRVSYMQMAVNIVSQKLEVGPRYQVQRIIYSTALTAMVLKNLDIFTAEGTINIDNLENLTPDELIQIANSAGSNVPGLEKFSGMSDEEKREELRKFLESNKS